LHGACEALRPYDTENEVIERRPVSLRDRSLMSSQIWAAAARSLPRIAWLQVAAVVATQPLWALASSASFSLFNKDRQTAR
jgi:hypothetical protein